jgi:hypothetical protein
MRKSHGGGEFDQSTSYALYSQWNPFVQLMYANKKRKESSVKDG